MSPLDVRRMRVLREVSRHGSLAAAARMLGYTPSAVSQHVAQLERETGVPLVRRSKNQLELTEAGRLLVEHAEVVLDQLALAEQQLQATAGLHVGRLRVGAFGTAAPTLVAPAIGEYAQQFPEANIVALEADPDDSLPRLRQRELDLVVTYEYDLCPLPEDGGLMRRLVHTDPFRVVLPRTHPLAGRREVALPEVRDEAWIVEPRPDCHHFTIKACAAVGIEARVSCECSSYYLSQALVAAGLGIALVPDLALITMHPEVVAIPLGGDLPLVRRVYATCRAGEEDMPSLRTMIAILERIGEAHRPVVPAPA